MIKTINLTGSEMKVTELGGDNTEIINNSTGTVYASKLPNIAVGGDDVIAIPAGAIDGLYGTHGTVYLLGTGSVELRGVDHKITEARSQPISGSIGVVQDYIDTKDTATLAAAHKYADLIKSELAGFIGYTDNDIYGLEADFENCKFTRLAGAVGKTAGADFDSVNAYGGGRRRCNLSDSGEVLAYYGDENFKADGSNGQVMVEQPKFYYRVVPLKTEKIDGADGYHLRKARYYISDTPKAGFKVHPAFVRNGIEVDKIYLSAFEGCIYDTSAGKYLLEDEQVADFGSDKLSSISGVKPCSGVSQHLTRANARNLAHNRGAGWEQYTIQSIAATQLLYIVEYAGFNIQLQIGNGNVNKNDIKLTNVSDKTGGTISLGNVGGISESQSVTYRGEENLWGNITCLVDGVVSCAPLTAQEGQYSKIYVQMDNFSDDVEGTNSLDTHIYSVMGSGFTSAFGYSKEFDWILFVSETNGNTALPIGDFYWNGLKGFRTVSFGGRWSDSSNAGIFCMNMYGDITWRNRDVNARIQFIPTA